MKGIECAFFGLLAKEPELKTSKSGKPWASISVGVDTGDVDDSGGTKLQWLRVAVFGEAASRLAGAQKGTRLYIEGTLTLDHWEGKDGEAKHGLSVAAWKCERIGASAIGRQRPAREKGQEYAAGSTAIPASYCAGPAGRTQAPGRDRFELDDALPF
jgi:single-stranded DNA-binding protein